MRGWSEWAHRWAEELDQVAPYIEYIDTNKTVARLWREAVQELISKIQKFT
jgi:hypothetical protein